MKKKPLAIAAALIGSIAVVIATQLGADFGLGSIGPSAPSSLSPGVSASTSASLEAAGFAVVDESGQLVVDAPAALAALDELDVATQLALGYDRQLFGQRWADVDRNGCDTRNDILARDLTELTFKPGTRDCVVLTGVLHDTYTGTTIDFERGEKTSQLVQIDHLVPLAWAWRHGANAWDDTTRTEFANDPINLQAVDGRTNQVKSDSGPGAWMPPAEGYHCEYAARYVLVLTAYHLAIDDLDRGALAETLHACGRD